MQHIFKAWKSHYGVKVYACCLMTNHVHLLLKLSESPPAKRTISRHLISVNLALMVLAIESDQWGVETIERWPREHTMSIKTRDFLSL